MKYGITAKADIITFDGTDVRVASTRIFRDNPTKSARYFDDNAIMTCWEWTDAHIDALGITLNAFYGSGFRMTADEVLATFTSALGWKTPATP
ncbi:MAG: hypothetical protein FWF25_06190 [Propionibacteriaceae bacterium]|nr:hypothetical protein [Propionibacteriaceae bacterium]